MTKIATIFLCCILLFASCTQQPQINSSRTILFDFDWRFALGEFPEASKSGFNDSAWRQLNVPHDFIIEQPFDSLNQTGKGGGYAYSGTGWYRKHFILDKNTRNNKVFVLFNGIYRNSEVWINDHYLGIRPYGYSSFYYDLTEYLNPAGEENILSVKVDTKEQPNSRWYTGAGIYRHVYLVVKNNIRIARWGVFAHTTEADTQNAGIQIESELINDYSMEKPCNIEAKLLDADMKPVAETNTDIKLKHDSVSKLVQNINIQNPKLWSIDNPYLYHLQIEIKSGNEVYDTYTVPFGIRTFRFDPDKGFFLNGKHVKLFGTNNHHDGGPLGAACMDYTFVRQLKILKEMGCNALRMSHNPPAPELLYAADSLGFVVINEIFDEWKRAKTPAGYSPHFDKWFGEDIANWIKRDRNHPSVAAWSIGNEVLEQWGKEEEIQMEKNILETSKQFDTTRPFTAGCNGVPDINENGFGELLDLVGYNYKEPYYEEDHAKFPDRVIFASETVKYPYQPGDCSAMHSYDQWLTGQLEDFVAGEFIWTGFDYLGEAGIGEGGVACDPWNEWPGWPYRGATCGMIDICGFKKPGYYFRKILWTDEPQVYIAVETDKSAKNPQAVPFWGWPDVQPHWNHDKEGEKLIVHVYTNIPDVELILNNKSFGTKHFDIQNEAFLTWEVPYEKGILKAVGVSANGEKKTCILQTTGEPEKIRLTTDKKALKANQQDIAYIKAELLDKNDLPVPFTSNIVEFEVKGQGQLLSVGNGDQTSHTPFTGNKMEAYIGKCLAIVKSGSKKGTVTITACSSELEKASLTIQVK